MKVCQLCKKNTITELLNLGMQPICNRFLANQDDEEFKFPLIIEQCSMCGVVQIAEPVKASELFSRYSWITYNEPENHLDDLAKTISKLPGVTKDSLIFGISFKDDSTLMRLKNLGFEQTRRINPKYDLGIAEIHIGVETIQDRLTFDIADTIVKKYGKSEVVIARHIIEHAHDLSGFLNTLKQLVTEEGYIVIEVPDCLDAFEKLDYTTLWEEHSIYFTSETLHACFMLSGFSPVYSKCYPNLCENSLVVIVKPINHFQYFIVPDDKLKEERARARNFAQKFTEQREKIRRYFLDYRQKHGKIVLFGAGHFACTYINLLGLKDIVDFIVDDNPNKRGLFMPGSKLPIYGSSSLIEENVRLCLLSLNPISEDKVIKINQEFLNRGGTFSSIFPSSKRALKI